MRTRRVGPCAHIRNLVCRKDFPKRRQIRSQVSRNHSHLMEWHSVIRQSQDFFCRQPHFVASPRATENLDGGTFARSKRSATFELLLRANGVFGGYFLGKGG